ncbi:Hypothetical predicted protein [Xyrichtys novacula]|uniref:Uncharacterized protein n=1 Tax=Xyrichtys novacula TaxID=13765 RepID=A0AAV1H5U5_XYRNO|nr:Hypothetical predicted protein [Xyrichtys novacula]
MDVRTTPPPQCLRFSTDARLAASFPDGFGVSEDERERWTLLQTRTRLLQLSLDQRCLNVTDPVVLLVFLMVFLHYTQSKCKLTPSSSQRHSYITYIHHFYNSFIRVSVSFGGE